MYPICYPKSLHLEEVDEFVKSFANEVCVSRVIERTVTIKNVVVLAEIPIVSANYHLVNKLLVETVFVENDDTEKGLCRVRFELPSCKIAVNSRLYRLKDSILPNDVLTRRTLRESIKYYCKNDDLAIREIVENLKRNNSLDAELCSYIEDLVAHNLLKQGRSRSVLDFYGSFPEYNEILLEIMGYSINDIATTK